MCIHVPPLVVSGVKEIVPHLSSVISNGATSIYAHKTEHNNIMKFSIYKLISDVRNIVINNSASSK